MKVDLRWGVGAGFIAHNSCESGGGCFLGGTGAGVRLLSAVDLVLVAEGEHRVGENVAGMAEQNESGVWGLMLLGLIWWLGWGRHSWGVLAPIFVEV